MSHSIRNQIFNLSEGTGTVISQWNPPLSLTSSLISTGVKLDWISVGVIEVWSSSDGATYALINTTADGVQTYNDTSLSGVNMLYKVRESKGGKYSGFSNVTSISLTPVVLNPVYWWDFADATKVTVTGTGISACISKGSNALSIGQSDDAKRPTWTDSNCAEFNGTTDWLGATLTDINQPFSFFLDNQINAAAAGANYVISYGTGSQRLNWNGLYAMSNGTNLAAINASGFTRRAITCIGNGATSKIYYDGTVEVTGDSGANGFRLSFRMGANEYNNSYHKGKTFELVVISGIASAAQIAWYQKYQLRRENPVGASAIHEGWIFGGQSNMVANAVIGDQTIPGYNTKLTKEYIWNPSNSVIELLNPAVNTSPKYNLPQDYLRFGSECAFLKDIEDDADYTLNHVAIKLAQGATALKAGLTTPDWSESSDNELFDILCGYITNTDNYLTSVGKKLRIRGIFWTQGENDISVQAEYLSNLNSFFTALRSHCDAINTKNGFSVDIFNIITRLSSGQSALGDITVIRAAQASFITTNGDILIDTDAIAVGVDNTHFTADGLINIGQAEKLAIDAIYTE